MARSKPKAKKAKEGGGSPGSIFLKHALLNALQHGGKADAGAVIGKVLAESPALRKDIASAREGAEKAAGVANGMTAEEQESMLREMVPDALMPVKREKQGLPELEGAVEGMVVTRFAPCPSGPLNVLHALRAVLLSYMYARMYKGKFILRFEDTDPAPGKILKEFYGMIREDLRFLGADWDEEAVESSDMAEFYSYAEELIRKGHAYVDFTPAEGFRRLKLEKKDPESRPATPQENMDAWKGMLAGKYSEGQAVLRFKTSMQDPNPAFRDPAIFRIAAGEHPLAGRKYAVWPLYNFANVVEDHKAGVTHIFRGKEHEHNSHIQGRICKALGWSPPNVLNFGMIYLPGTKDHTRDIKEKIGKGIYSGWDDPRLHTLAALRRRGFQGKAFQECAVVAGLSKTDIRFSMESLETANRKIIDPLANRYMAVFDPVKISLSGHPKAISSTSEPLHPDFQERGSKQMPVRFDSISISGDDYARLEGGEFRLKGLANVKLDGKQASYVGNELARDMQKVQWVSVPNVSVELVVPEGERLVIRKGMGEQAMSGLKPGSLIQMERVGFGRVDAVEKGRVVLYWAHK